MVKKRKILFFQFVIISFFLISIVSATNWYASPTGSSSGSGTISSPWDLSTALNKASTIKPGDTLYLRGGTYSGVFQSTLVGSSTNPIIVRGYVGERAILNDPGGAGDSSNTLKIFGSYTWYRDFEIAKSSYPRKSSQSGPWPTDVAYGMGVWISQGTGNKIINLIIHDNPLGGSIYIGQTNTELYGNLIYYNGWLGTDRPHGHGLYSQNQAPGTVNVSDNMFYFNSDEGTQFYGSSASHLDNLWMEGNAFFGNSRLFTGPATGANLLIGGDIPAVNANFKNNYIFRSAVTDTAAGSDFYWGYVSGGSQNGVITNNYIATKNQWGGTQSNLAMSGNTFYGTTTGLSTSSYPNNVWTTTRPTSNVIFVRSNAYETGRANIIIYNWQNLNSVSVSLSGIGLNSGDTYELHNVENYFGDIVTGTYNGGNIIIAMTGHTMATPVSASVPATTFPEFGAFVIRKTGSSTVTTTYHPADTNNDWIISSSESTTYRNLYLTTPTIPADFATVARSIYLTNPTGTYHYVSGTTCPPSSAGVCWIPG